MKIGKGQPYMTKEEKMVQQAAARDFRKAHFDLGMNSEINYQTHAQSTLIKHETPKDG